MQGAVVLVVEVDIHNDPRCHLGNSTPIAQQALESALFNHYMLIGKGRLRQRAEQPG